jgi:hypothetical protein
MEAAAAEAMETLTQSHSWRCQGSAAAAAAAAAGYSKKKTAAFARSCQS